MRDPSRLKTHHCELDGKSGSATYSATYKVFAKRATQICMGPKIASNQCDGNSTGRTPAWNVAITASAELETWQKKLGKTSGNSEAVPIPAAGRGRKQKSVACGFFLAAGHVEVH